MSSRRSTGNNTVRRTKKRIKMVLYTSLRRLGLMQFDRLLARPSDCASDTLERYELGESDSP
jgi:hypothetical protein